MPKMEKYSAADSGFAEVQQIFLASLKPKKVKGVEVGEGQKESALEVVGEPKVSEKPLKEWKLNVGEGGAETGVMFSHQGLFSNLSGASPD